jgi:osmotically inducible lipoprotein OsmB
LLFHYTGDFLMNFSKAIASCMLITLLAAPLGACGTTTGDRTVSGAGLGAAGGAAVGALAGGSAVTGALIGAAAGGVTGAATSSNDVDLGKPVWR